jgi:spore maturation protein CgeB
MITVVRNFEANYPEDPIRFFNFEDYNEDTKDCILFIGAHPHNSISNPNNLPKYFLSTEEQTWDLDSTDRYVPFVEKIFTICDPKFTNRAKREFSFFPTNQKMLPTTFDKEYDVIYTGYANATHVSDLLGVIRNYNYVYASFGSTNPFVTHTNVTYTDKLSLISKSKITVVHNLNGNNTPQLKSRPFEAALCKSLILCKKDDWNFIETWYEEGKEFLYYTDGNDLKEKIDEVLSNYSSYQEIINNAYQRSIENYTTEAFVNKHFKK